MFVLRRELKVVEVFLGLISLDAKLESELGRKRARYSSNVDSGNIRVGGTGRVAELTLYGGGSRSNADGGRVAVTSGSSATGASGSLFIGSAVSDSSSSGSLTLLILGHLLLILVLLISQRVMSLQDQLQNSFYLMMAEQALMMAVLSVSVELLDHLVAVFTLQVVLHLLGQEVA
jgi:hypothetical protein